MNEKQITLATREQRRAMVLNRVLADERSRREAAVVLDLLERQLRPLLGAYRRQGVAALVHGNRGWAPAHRVPPQVRDRIVTLAQG